MTIAVTGATGHFGHVAVEALLRHGVPAADVVATGRSTDRLQALEGQGVTVRRADYDDPASLETAFHGVEQLLLVSSSELGQRARHAGNALKAAAATGVGFVACTSITRAGTSSMLLAQEYRATEQLVVASGIPHALLRNSKYIDLYIDQLPIYLEHGIAGAAGHGRVSAAARADYAEAAATVVASPDEHAGRTYELGGAPFTMQDLAQVVSRVAGRTVEYNDLPVDDFQQVLVGAGIPNPAAAVYADVDRGQADGELFVDSGDLERLLGRPATSLEDAVTAALGALRV